jgi:hypothetical protein
MGHVPDGGNSSVSEQKSGCLPPGKMQTNRMFYEMVTIRRFYTFASACEISFAHAYTTPPSNTLPGSNIRASNDAYQAISAARREHARDAAKITASLGMPGKQILPIGVRNAG